MGLQRPYVEAVGLGLGCTFQNLDLHQPVAHQQGGRDGRLEGLLVLAAHDHPIDDRVHVGDLRLVE